MVPLPVGGGVVVCVKLAVAERAAVIESVQVEAVPAHEPPQPEKVYPEFGVAVRVTLVPLVYDSLQSVPQEIPVPVTVPFDGWVTVSV